MIVFAIIYKIAFLEMAVGVFGIISAIINSKGYKWGIILYAIYVIWYGFYCIFGQQYGLAIINLLFALPIYLGSLYKTYVKKNDDKELIIKVSPFKHYINCAVIMIPFVFGFSYVLEYMGSKMCFLNALASTFCIISSYLASKYHLEQWIFWFGYSGISMTIWLLNLDSTNLSSLIYLIMCFVYIIINIGGSITWIKLYKKQKIEIEKVLEN